MKELINLLLAINKAHKHHMTLDYGPGLGGLNQVYGCNHPTYSQNIQVETLCGLISSA